MSLPPGEMPVVVGYLRTLLTEKKNRLGRELDYTDKRDAVLAVKERYREISDDQLHEVMRQADE